MIVLFQEVFRVVLRLTVALLIFSLIFTLIMFLHYNRAIAIWPSLHPYHAAEPTTPMPAEEKEE